MKNRDILLLPNMECSCGYEFAATATFTDAETWQKQSEKYLSSPKAFQAVSCPHWSSWNISESQPKTFSLNTFLKKVELISEPGADIKLTQKIVQHITQGNDPTILNVLEKWNFVTNGGKRQDFTLNDAKGLIVKYETFTDEEPHRLVEEEYTSKDYLFHQWWHKYQKAEIVLLKLHKKQADILRSLDIPSIRTYCANNWGEYFILKSTLERLEKELQKNNWPLHSKKPIGPQQTLPDSIFKLNEHLHEVAEDGCVSFDFE